MDRIHRELGRDSEHGDAAIAGHPTMHVTQRTFPASEPVGRGPNRRGLNLRLDQVRTLSNFRLCGRRFDDPRLIEAFCRQQGKEGSFLNFRAAISHFVKWSALHSLHLADFNLASLEQFRHHSCSRARGRKHPISSSYIGKISRFIVMLHYQGVCGQLDWATDDEALINGFDKALIDYGLPDERAARTAINALHFIRWCRLRGVRRDQLTAEVFDEFGDHLCCCGFNGGTEKPGISQRSMRLTSAHRLRIFLENDCFVDKGRTIPRRDKGLRVDSIPAANEYFEWLVEQRYTSATQTSYRHDLNMWLPNFVKLGGGLSAKTIRAAVFSNSEERSTSQQAKCIRSARNYLRFVFERGDCSPDLLNCFLSAPVTKSKTSPKVLQPWQVLQVIDSCNLETRKGVRDQAILLLMAELGLRCVEIWRLERGDIDWHQARLNVRGKCGRFGILPLTSRAGEAVLSYLRTARPRSPENRIFLRLRSPGIAFSSPTGISDIARSQLSVCGFSEYGGAHAFRRSIASGILASGRTLQDVATVLGHSSLETTLAYAKVNERALRKLAEPWVEIGP